MTTEHKNDQSQVKIRIYPSGSNPDHLEIEFTIIGGDVTARSLIEKKLVKIMAEMGRRRTR